MRTIALTNLKGGVGKTTSAVQIAAALGEAGVRVLLVDADGQGHCSAFLNVPRRGNLAGVLLATRPDSDDASRAYKPTQHFIQRGVRQGVDLIACNPAISHAEAHIEGEAMRELRLKRRLAEVEGDYDLCLIDVGPKTDLLSTISLLASDWALIVTTPATPDASLTDMVMRLNTLTAEAGMGPKVIGVLSTQVDVREGLGRDLANKLTDAGLPQLPSIPRNVGMARATRAGQTIFEYAPHNPCAEAYRAVAHWLQETA